MSRPFPRKCATCRERAVQPATLESYSMEIEHDGRKYQVSLTNLEVTRCAHCGAIVLDDAANRRLSDALRAEADLLLPSEIRTKREALGLTQKQMASLLQISESTLARWETGAQIQQRCMDRFLRGFYEVRELRRFLGASESSWVALELTRTEVPS